MIYSMTGFGKSSAQLAQTNYLVEIKSLNSKQLDLSIRMPGLLKEKEIEVRRLISDTLLRGKVDVYISSEKGEETIGVQINAAVFENYFLQMKEIQQKLNFDAPDMLNAILKLPNVLQTKEITIEENEFDVLISGITEAMKNLNEFRRQEGTALELDIQKRIEIIQELNKTIEKAAPQRAERIKEKILDNLQSLQEKLDVNKDRFEQEMIFYLEKLDVTEEVVRLENHCTYFLETMHSEEASVGKKLAFISQELGREINTIGSKANDVNIQKLVVQMKDELEKIKEQLNNVL